jgi:competence ComEA-like helix-hairpin-helix protein
MIHTILSYIATPKTRALAALLVLALAAAATPAAAAAPDGVVNVNTADESQLSLLPRVGPSTAARIVEFRDANGAFEAARDLMLVRGIGERTFELLEGFVVIEGDTTLTEKVRVSDLEEAPAEEQR